MERAIIHSDLKTEEIHPSKLLSNYKTLLKEDIKKHLVGTRLKEFDCPVSNSIDILQSFTKLGMQYQMTQSFRNIYLSPRPTLQSLKNFYFESKARSYWLTDLWNQTYAMREEKVILPQLEWVEGFLGQYCDKDSRRMVEYYPNNWAYILTSKNYFPNNDYKMVDILFNPLIADESVTNNIEDEIVPSSLDAVLLFEALDRAPNPKNLLNSVKQSLKPGGLCFITCLLSSGFEVQVLGQKSDIFVPPERMNLFSYEGMNALIKKLDGFEILEFSTPGVLDITNVINKLEEVNNLKFFEYLFKLRDDPSMVLSFQDFLQMNRLGTFGRLVLRKK